MYKTYSMPTLTSNPIFLAVEFVTLPFSALIAKARGVQISRRAKGVFFAVISFIAITAIYIYFSISSREGFFASITTAHPSIPSTTPFTIGSKVAAIIETRAMDTLIPLILHFAAILGPTWPIVLFTRSSNTFASAPLARLIAAGRIEIRILPDSAIFSNSATVSFFLTSPWLWEQLAPAKHVLFFQSDSILCGNSAQTVDDFLAYDYVGAPISPEWGVGFNGGLSLRNREVFLDIVMRNNFTEEYYAGEFLSPVEDQWYYRKMLELPLREDGSPGARLPSVETASRFAVETVWAEQSLGYHQVRRWQMEHIEEVEKWCPDYRLSTSEFIGLQGGGA